MYESGLTLPLFPIQLCESVIMIVIFFILLYLYSSKKFHGKILFYYFILYSISRVFLEIFRGDLDRGFVINGIFSINQLISLLVLFIALYSIVIFKDNKI
jgi:phosphatidylglycerol:prolipoprotein diacylglycerol transferase